MNYDASLSPTMALSNKTGGGSDFNSATALALPNQSGPENSKENNSVDAKGSQNSNIAQPQSAQLSQFRQPTSRSDLSSNTRNR